MEMPQNEYVKMALLLVSIIALPFIFYFGNLLARLSWQWLLGCLGFSSWLAVSNKEKGISILNLNDFNSTIVTQEKEEKVYLLMNFLQKEMLFLKKKALFITMNSQYNKEEPMWIKRLLMNKKEKAQEILSFKYIVKEYIELLNKETGLRKLLRKQSLKHTLEFFERLKKHFYQNEKLNQSEDIKMLYNFIQQIELGIK